MRRKRPIADLLHHQVILLLRARAKDSALPKPDRDLMERAAYLLEILGHIQDPRHVVVLDGDRRIEVLRRVNPEE